MNIRKIAISLACLLCLQCMTQAITPKRLRELRNNFEELMKKDISQIDNVWLDNAQKIINELKTARHQPDILNIAEMYKTQYEQRLEALHEYVGKEGAIFTGEKTLKTVSDWENGFKALAQAIIDKAPWQDNFKNAQNLIYTPNWNPFSVSENLVAGVRNLEAWRAQNYSALDAIAKIILLNGSTEEAQWNETHDPQIIVNTLIAQIKNYVAMLESTSRELGELGELRNWAKKNYPDKYQKFQQERIAQAPSKSN